MHVSAVSSLSRPDHVSVPLTLCDRRRSSFAQRAWITLREKNLNFEHKIVDLKEKPKHFKDLYASIHPDPAAPAKVPIIIGMRTTAFLIRSESSGHADAHTCDEHGSMPSFAIH